MWVSHLIAKNVRSFEDLEIHFDRKMNILLGANNSGKSTILRVLYRLQDQLILQPSDIRISKEEMLCYIQFEEPHTNKSIAQQMNRGFLSNIYITGDRNHLRAEMRYAANNRPESFSFSSLEPDNFIYPYFSKRKVLSYRREISRSLVFQVTDTLQYLVPKVDHLANEYYTKHAEFEQACIDILGFPITTFHAEDSNGKQIGIIVDDYHNIPLEAMGEGVPNLLGLIVNLCMAENKLFLIEELENDIHPKALKRLLELIIRKAEHNQFIVSTHSNIVTKYLGSIPKSKLHYISLTTYTADNRLPTAMYREVENTAQERKEALESLGYDLVDYGLAKAWIFFEESTAERIIREFLIPTFISSLTGKLNTIAAGGTSDIEPKFADFSRLFLFLHLESMYKNHAWVMIDGDNSGQKVIANLKERYLSSGWAENRFINFTKNNFEEYYPERFQEEVHVALSIKDKQEKRATKKQLFEKVMAWIVSNQEQAKVEFELSAREVIDRLKTIEAELG